jgi:signal transduction histidine kinase
MYAISTMLKSKTGDINFFDGSLFILPAELRDKWHIDRYSKTDNAGWKTDLDGYWIYSKFDHLGNLIIVPGLRISNKSKPKKKYPGQIEFSQSQIEMYVKDLIEFQEISFENASEDVNILIHDLRNISTSIYNAAEEARIYVGKQNFFEATTRVNNIIAAQSILRIRTDILDFLGNPASLINNKYIPVYRKTDKVVRTLKPRANGNKVEINISGTSVSHCVGPEVFEIVPFVIIENAIKYAPMNSYVDVGLKEENAKIHISVKSVGPKINFNERESIFERGVRGAAAKNMPATGTGLGLFLLKQIVVNHFGGTVDVSQDPFPATNFSSSYFNTEFTVSIPIAGSSS